jgi:hypothetical protein
LMLATFRPTKYSSLISSLSVSTFPGPNCQ